MFSSLFDVWWTVGLVGLWVFSIFKLVKNGKKLVEKNFDFGTFIKVWFLFGLFLYLPYMIFCKVDNQCFMPGIFPLRVYTSVKKDDQGRVITKKVVTRVGPNKVEVVEIEE